MMRENPVTRTLRPSVPFLDVVARYLDLITTGDRLNYGSGLKYLYALSSGVDTFHGPSVQEALVQMEEAGLIDTTLDGFLMASIRKNLFLYGALLRNKLIERIIAISSGEVRNPEPMIVGNPMTSRRWFYNPPKTLLDQVTKVCTTYRPHEDPIGLSFADVSQASVYELTVAQARDGHLYPAEASYAQTMAAANALVEILRTERELDAYRDYRLVSRPAVQILLVLEKFLEGDLTVSEAKKVYPISGEEGTIALFDGTLAAIPAPHKGDLATFADREALRMGRKGVAYLGALSRYYTAPKPERY